MKLLLAGGADAKARDRRGKSVLGAWSYRADQILRAQGAEESLRLSIAQDQWP